MLWDGPDRRDQRGKHRRRNAWTVLPAVALSAALVAAVAVVAACAAKVLA